jgi:hypothetical protein
MVVGWDKADHDHRDKPDSDSRCRREMQLLNRGGWMRQTEAAIGNRLLSVSGVSVHFGGVVALDAQEL